MLTPAEIKIKAYELAKLGDTKLTPTVRLLFDLADQLDYLEERDIISDSRIQLLRASDDSCKDELKSLQEQLLESHEINAELRKQVRILKDALIK